MNRRPADTQLGLDGYPDVPHELTPLEQAPGGAQMELGALDVARRVITESGAEHAQEALQSLENLQMSGKRPERTE